MPRFNFLSDEELLDVLAQRGNSRAIQPYMSKCFQNAKRLVFASDEEEERKRKEKEARGGAGADAGKGKGKGGEGGEGHSSDSNGPGEVDPEPELSFNLRILKQLEPAQGKDAAQAEVVVGLQSEEGEVLRFPSAVSAAGPVEGWLGGIVASMGDAIRSSLAGALVDLLAQDDLPEKARAAAWAQWIFAHPAQVVASCSLIRWTDSVEQALLESGTHHHALGRIHGETMRTLKALSELVLAPLSALDRATASALIILTVHCRDVVKQLVAVGAAGIECFEWAMQLRFYWDEEGLLDGGAGAGPGAGSAGAGAVCSDEAGLVIRLGSAVFRYGTEYLGNTSRLVVTPLTERCYAVLTGALRECYGGSPLGPAGTGKTETVKDLAKVLGRQCIVFNCKKREENEKRINLNQFHANGLLLLLPSHFHFHFHLFIYLFIYLFICHSCQNF